MLDLSRLEGIDFDHGKQDCYTMLQTIYGEELGITLSDYARFDDWWIKGENLYTENFKSEGFVVLDPETPVVELREYDVFLVALPDPRCGGEGVPANHCCVYIGEGKIIHHRLGKRSQIKNYQGMLRDFTTHILRHPKVPYKKHQVKTIDLIDHINPEMSRQLKEALENAGT